MGQGVGQGVGGVGQGVGQGVGGVGQGVGKGVGQGVGGVGGSENEVWIWATVRRRCAAVLYEVVMQSSQPVYVYVLSVLQEIGEVLGKYTVSTSTDVLPDTADPPRLRVSKICSVSK